MTSQVDNVAEQEQQFVRPPMQKAQSNKRSVMIFLAFISLLILLFSSLLITSLPDLLNARRPVVTHNTPLQVPGGGQMAALHLTGGQEILYVQQNSIYTVPVTGGTPRQLTTPGFLYNRAAPPSMISTHELLYSGAGIWVVDLVSGHIRQVAIIASDQVITALALSEDAAALAWSSAPKNGSGAVTIYAGPIGETHQVYQQQAHQCPCFRVFSFLHGSGVHTTLLLTNDRGDIRPASYGLWALDLTGVPAASQPQIVLTEDLQQGPLALQENMLLYSTYQGLVVPPEDYSVPSDLDSAGYANSLALAQVEPSTLQLGKLQVLVPEQRELSNSAAYHWITTPRFSADARTLLYVEFSSDAREPFTRHTAIYIAQVVQGQISKPELLATTQAHYLELGNWLNDHVLTFYADKALYALDIRANALSQIAQVKSYTSIVAVANAGSV